MPSACQVRIFDRPRGRGSDRGGLVTDFGFGAAGRDFGFGFCIERGWSARYREAVQTTLVKAI